MISFHQNYRLNECVMSTKTNKQTKIHSVKNAPPINGTEMTIENANDNDKHRNDGGSGGGGDEACNDT